MALASAEHDAVTIAAKADPNGDEVAALVKMGEAVGAGMTRAGDKRLAIVGGVGSVVTALV